MIDGVEIVPLRRMDDARGAVIPMLRADAPHFRAFGEIYFSIVAPGAIKAWKCHRRMTLNLAVPAGDVVFVLQDSRPDSPTRGQTQVHRSAAAAPTLLIVPPGVWSGFTNPGTGPAVVANCADMPHDPSEADQRTPDDPPLAFDWSTASSS